MSAKSTPLSEEEWAEIEKDHSSLLSYWERQTDEDLVYAIEHGLTHSEPCWCGTSDEGSCPACGIALNGVSALREFNRRYALLERALEFSSSTQSDGWHLTVCRAERRGDPRGSCIEECAALRKYKR